MLVHATLRHDIDNCPGFDPDLLGRTMEAFPKIDEIAAKFGVTVRDLYNAAPDHVEYMVVETPDNMALALFLAEAVPYKVDIETHVVADRAAMRTMLEQMR